jgi:hypothetical protein
MAEEICISVPESTGDWPRWNARFRQVIIHAHVSLSAPQLGELGWDREYDPGVPIVEETIAPQKPEDYGGQLVATAQVGTYGWGTPGLPYPFTPLNTGPFLAVRCNQANFLPHDGLSNTEDGALLSYVTPTSLEMRFTAELPRPFTTGLFSYLVQSGPEWDVHVDSQLKKWDEPYPGFRLWTPLYSGYTERLASDNRSFQESIITLRDDNNDGHVSGSFSGSYRYTQCTGLNWMQDSRPIRKCSIDDVYDANTGLPVIDMKLEDELGSMNPSADHWVDSSVNFTG